MADVGDRVEVKSKSGTRTAVVIGVSGSLLRLRWDNGEETLLVPGAGVLSVVAEGTRRAPRARRGATGATTRPGPTKAPAKKAPAKRSSPAKKDSEPNASPSKTSNKKKKSKKGKKQ